MNSFEEQLKIRKQNDDYNFEDALSSVAGAVMGDNLAQAYSSKEIAQSAIDEVLKYYHCKVKSDEIPDIVKSVDEQIEYRMRPFGIMRRTVTLDGDWYKNAVGVMLGTTKKDGRAVALIPGKIYGYSYLDIDTGKRIRVNKRNRNLIESEALCFYKPLPMRKLTVADLLLFMVQNYSISDLVLFIGIIALISVAGLMAPNITKILFGQVLNSGSELALLGIAVFMVCYSVCRVLLNTFQAFVNARVGTKQSIAVQSAVMGRILNLPATFFKNYAAGELSQYASAVQDLCSTIMNSIATVGITSLFSLIYVGQIFEFAPSLVVPSLLITLATVIVTTITTFAQMSITKKRLQVSVKLSGLTYSTIKGIQKIKLSGSEKRMFARWAKTYAKEAALTYNPPIGIKLSGVTTTAISVFGTMLLYFLAVKNNVSVADYYAFNASYGQIAAAFTALASMATTIANIKPVLDMAKPILEAEPAVSEGKVVITELSGEIEFSNVSFSYNESMPNVIDDFSLKIHPGEYLAIVGSTGCGKSTLLRLLLGFEKPQKGAIYYDQKDMNGVDLKSLRRKIGTVMQDGKLFFGDIYSNISISAPELTVQDAWIAAEIASVADDIRRMPMGMNTIISEGQGGISGGQKQRLMIARAIAPRPRILMFDEATSALDNITQKRITDAIDKLHCTRIVIAHRLSTIQHADRIIYLDKGKIVEDGTYDELIKKNGMFAELVKRQRIDVDAE